MHPSVDIPWLIERFHERSAQRLARLQRFSDLSRPGGDFIVIQRPAMSLWGSCNDVETIFRNNLASMEAWLALDWTDELPYLEPWIGTGIYANAFGCEYHWRDNEAPAVHYLFHTVDEIRNVEPPDWRKSPIMAMVLETIDRLKEGTRGQFPIALTDTQSPYDTATLILDACEFFIACCEEPETVKRFLGIITDLLVEFSREQMRRIGDDLLAKPGHIMASIVGGRGISLSDDNLAVGSPRVNLDISMPFNQRIAEAFGGVAIHACGAWHATMKHLSNYPGVFMIDCAAERQCDPNPNDPSELRQALDGQNIIAKVRVGSNMATALPAIRRFADKRMRLVVEMAWDEAHAESNYHQVRKTLEDIYASEA